MQSYGGGVGICILCVTTEKNSVHHMEAHNSIPFKKFCLKLNALEGNLNISSPSWSNCPAIYTSRNPTNRTMRTHSPLNYPIGYLHHHLQISTSAPFGMTKVTPILNLQGPRTTLRIIWAEYCLNRAINFALTEVVI